MWDPEFQPLRASRNHSKKGDVQLFTNRKLFTNPTWIQIGDALHMFRFNSGSRRTNSEP